MIQIPPELESVLTSDPETLSGAIRFRGTRIHASIVINNVLSGVPFEEVLTSYPGISRENVLMVLDWYAANRVNPDFNPGQQAS